MLSEEGVAGLWRLLGRVVRPANAFVRLPSAVQGFWANMTSQQAPVETDEQVSRSQAQKMESLGRLTGGVAHDFNNLLTVVLGNAAALRVSAEARGDAQAMRRAEMIERAAERGGRLAGQLLSFSGKQVLRPEIVSVYRVLSAIHELLAQA